jgi:hypothetical protein
VPNYLPERGEYFVSAAPVLLRVSPRPPRLLTGQATKDRDTRQSDLQAPPVDLMNPAIRAEIARHVAVALQQERQQNASHQKAGRVSRFPGAG